MILHIIDGNSLLFRAYYATSFSGNIMRTKDGFPTNAIFGFSNMINKIVASLHDDDRIVVCFDTGKKTFRHEEYPEYKAQRKETDEDLKLQIPIARDLLKAMGVFYYEQEGYEADDIAGTIARKASAEGIRAYCYTSDKDYLQLIDDRISVKMIRKGLSDIEEMDAAALKAKMGITSEQICDYKGLMGDPSDNLKGIPGIGEKTAIKLLNQYGSLENIIENMRGQTSKIAQKITENAAQGLLCKKLATIDTKMELPFQLDQLAYPGYDYNQLSSFYTRYECFSLLKRLKPRDKQVIHEQSDRLDIEVVEVSGFSAIPDPRVLIPDLDEGNYHTAYLHGIYFSSGGRVYYLSKRFFDDPEFVAFMKDPARKKITYDYKALKVALHRFQIEVEGLGFDFSLAAYLINPSLTNDPVHIFGYFGVNLLYKDNLTLLEENYFDKMAYHLERLYPSLEAQIDRLEDKELYYEVELPLCNILSEMEIEGFPLNAEVLQKINDEYTEKLEEIQKEIYALAGYTFNLASPKQVAELLFTRLHLPSNKKESTSIEVLNSLKELHPIVPLLIEHRKYSKIISTYSQGLLAYLYADGKIHTLFNQTLTQTGRLSSSEPNLQNISTRSEEGKAVRKAFFYDDDTHYLLSLDYSQVELRVLASMSNCQELIDVFNRDGDIHSATAMKIFHVDEAHLTPELRRQAKTVNFGIIYGISDWGLSERISTSAKEAKEVIQTFYDEYPEIRDYFAETIAKAKENGYCSTLYHRRRYIPELSSDNYQTREFGKRIAMNAPIQGTAADIMKICMIKVDRFLKENHYKTRIVLQIHDELIFKVPKEECEKMPAILKNIMENCVDTLKVKLKVDGSIAKTWYECK